MMHYPHRAEIAHRTPGRIRLRLFTASDGEFLALIAGRLAELPGVANVSSNRHAASIVIRHDEAMSLGDLARVLSESGIALVTASDAPERFLRSDEPQVRRARRTDRVIFLLELALVLSMGGPLAQLIEFLVQKVARAVIRSIAGLELNPYSAA